MKSVRHNQAISAALTLASSPALVDVMRRHPLPEDVLDLLYVFSGEETALRDALSWCGTTELNLMAAIENYVQRVMIYDGANPYRALGLNDGASRDMFRLHLKLLMRGCHPDQSGDPWRAVYAARVIEAWKALSGGQDVPVIEPVVKKRKSVGSLSFISHHHAAPRQRALSRFADRLAGFFGKKRVKPHRFG